MLATHFLKLRLRDDVDEAEEAAIRACISEIVEVPAGKVIAARGVDLTYSTLLLDGFLARYKDLSDGERQITHVHVPGDFADLHGFTLKRLDHSVLTLTPCTIAKAPHDRILRVTETHPHLARLFWFSTNLDAAIHREWVVSLGRRNAIERTAHLFCELHARLGVVGQSDEHGYAFPLTQAELAECLGLTSVHVNRVLKELREAGVVEFRGGRVSIGDMAALRRIAEFDPDYLYLEKRAR
ncbi:Crp/Fnr family transcriptional regulator [Sphingomonas sp. CJ20]